MGHAGALRGRPRPGQDFLRVALALGLVAGVLVADGLLAAGPGASPITDFRGQTLKAGHFWQPATIAIGQRVMAGFQS
jgi:hypothetical protein